MLSHCLKYRENTKKKKKKNQKFQALLMIKKWHYQVVLYAAVKNQNLWKKQEANGLLSSLEIKNQNENSFSWSSFVLIILITIL